MLFTEAAQAGGELDQLGVLRDRAPVKPGELVVLAVRVVIAALAARKLVAAEQQRDAFGEQQRGDQVALLTR